nr:hypothetical protein Hi04_10k_c2220_00023 [uncultured bacterium]
MTVYRSVADFARDARAGKAAGSLIKATLATTVKATARDRVLRFTISDATVDRMGDTITVAGWKLDNFKRNPVVLWAHQQDTLPVAKCTAIGVQYGRLVAEAEFCGPDVNPFGEQCLQAFKQGYLSAVSVGFMAVKWRWMNPADPENSGIVFEESDLTEWSCVTVPANPNALIEGRSAPQPAAPSKAQPAKLLTLHLQQLAALRR